MSVCPLLGCLPTASWPKIIVSVDPVSTDKPFSTTHTPPLPNGSAVVLDRSRLCVEELISQCVQLRSSALLKDLCSMLRGTIWEGRGE